MASLYLQATIALFFVISLMIGAAFLFRWINRAGWIKQLRPTSRIQIVDTLFLDSKRKLLIIRCDQKEYMLLTHPNQDVLLDVLPSSEKPSSTY